ncbi:MAG: iron ABC transporter permease [Chloroflexi bacterium]|nr:iron ABC transporter permease [Chloroflexota bacterium]
MTIQENVPLLTARPPAWLRPGRAPRLTPLHLAGIAVAALVALPVIYLVVRTFSGDSSAAELIFRTRTAEILFRSILLVAIVTAGSIAIAVPMAWLTLRTDLPLKRFWAVTAVLPLVIPSFIAGFVAVVALGPRGMLQGLLDTLFGVDRIPDMFGLPGASFVLILLTFPYVLIPVRASLRRMDPSMEEMARGLGRGSVRTFATITLPLLRPAIAAGGLLSALYTLSDFGAVSILRYETFTWAVFLQYESAFDRSIAAALSLVLVAVALGILAVDVATRGRGRYHRTTVGTVRPPRQVELGRWRWPAFGFAASVVGLSLAAPLAVLVFWAARGASRGEDVGIEWSTVLNSLQASGLAAVFTTLAAIPVAILAVRHRSLLTAAIDLVTHLGFALPGIAVALALVFFGINVFTPIYQTRTLLVVAYVVLFLPAAAGAIKASLMQVNPRIEEAARGLGKGPWQVTYRITFPLVLPGILAGAATVFLLTMKELPATLILGPIGFKTLSTQIWGFTTEAFFARAAVPALVLVIASGIPAAFLLLRDTSTSSASPANTETVTSDPGNLTG